LGNPDSGARLFAVSAQGIDLLPQLFHPLLITASDGHSESEFELLKLVPTFGITTGLTGRAAVGFGSVWTRAMAVGKGHGSLSSHCGTDAKRPSGRE
jgi:hypothetical protein